MDQLHDIAAGAQEITEAAAEIAELVAQEAAEQPAPVAPAGDVAGAIHEVSIEERLANCQERIAILEERLSSVTITAAVAQSDAQSAQLEAEQASNLALEALRQDDQTEVSSATETVEPEVSPTPATKPRNPWWVDLIALP